MILHPPFTISSALAPALKIGDATLSLLEVIPGERDVAVFELRTPAFTYVDDKMRSGMQGFQSTVEVFNTFLTFMDACAEGGENEDLFPPHVREWLLENRDEMTIACLDIEDENGNPLTRLIEE